VALDWQPFELRPGAPETGWAIPDYVRARMKAPDNPFRERVQRLGIRLVEREWIPSSRRAHECTEVARSQGRLEPFHAAVLRAYFREAKDLHDWAVLEEAANAAGLDAQAMRATVEAGDFRAAVDERVAAAHELGIHAVPTFVFGDRFAVQGAQELPVFERAMERLGARRR
jgi:predicted DsbA family dithiol-disulfide isomerase